MICGKGDVDVEGDADSKDSDNDVDLFEEKRYKKTNAANWRKHENGQPRWMIHPIPFTGRSEFFRPNIIDIEMKDMIKEHGNVHFHKIFEWMLPMFDGKSFYECCQHGCATTCCCCTASNQKGGCHVTIVLPMGRSSLLMTLLTFLDAKP